MSECTHDCSTCQENCGERETQDLRAKLNPAASVKKVIAVVSGKGGVGKSLVTGLLASKMQSRGYQAAVLDADITARRSLRPSASASMPAARKSCSSPATQTRARRSCP